MRLEYIKPWGDHWRVRYINNAGQVDYAYLHRPKFRDELDVLKWWNNRVKEQTDADDY